MRRMTDFEKLLYKTVEHNSLLFLEDGVKRLISGGHKGIRGKWGQELFALKYCSRTKFK